MKFNYLVVIVPAKWLPQNTEQAQTQIWGQVTQMLLPDLGRLYSRFYPAPNPWGQDIQSPYGVVLGLEDPVKFLKVLYEAQKKQGEAIAFHAAGMLYNADMEKMQKIGDALICHVIAGESSEELTAHTLWHVAMTSGFLMPDCGVYYLEQKQAVIGPEQEKMIAAHPGDYALCAVTLEDTEDTK